MPLPKRIWIPLLLLTLAAAAVAGDWWWSVPAGVRSTYVGRDTCAECHAAELKSFALSHHDLAMQVPSEATVLGDFNDAQLEHFGIVSTMFRRGDAYWVRTEGPGGDLDEFRIKYVFGVTPLQQYLVELDRPAGMADDEQSRLQVLRISWDTEEHRWYYLSPPDVAERLAPDDPLHWTQSGQNWNHMCADCHSTNVDKNFQLSDLQYHTTFSELDVSCETCHGPGSLHVQLARSRSLFWDRIHGYGLARLKASDPQAEIQSCAACHSRRQVVYPHHQPNDSYYDYFSNSLLTADTYYPDGQVLDEVYVYGSFLQSKMYAKGVRCTDCHNPHTTRLKHQGNNVCTSCHQHPAAKYDSPAHHHHQPGSTGASCVECHMPASPFMEIDFRRDHSLRIPRPDLSVAYQTPNACTGCHLPTESVSAERLASLPHYAAWMQAGRAGDTTVQAALAERDEWARQQCLTWYGEPKEERPHFAHALAAAWDGDRAAAGPLAELATDRRVAGIVRATALTELGRLDAAAGAQTAEQVLSDSDPQVRAAAVSLADTMTTRQRYESLVPLLQDPRRVIRIEAARVLAGTQGLNAQQQTALESASRELLTGLEYHSDQAGAHMGRALLYERQGKLTEAVEAYRTAIRVQPLVTGPRTNLAALLEQQGHTAEASELRKEELPLLARDARLAPDNAPLQYRYGLALYLDGRAERATRQLQRATELAPREPQFWMTLALLYQRRGLQQEALEASAQLLQLAPDDPQAQAVWQSIRGAR